MATVRLEACVDGISGAVAFCAFAALAACRPAPAAEPPILVSSTPTRPDGSELGLTLAGRKVKPADSSVPVVTDPEPWKRVDPESDGDDICSDDMSYAGMGCSSSDPTFECSVNVGPSLMLRATVCHPTEGYWAIQHDACASHIHVTLGEFNRRFACKPAVARTASDGGSD
jgi:hypothetical protein